MNKKLFSVLFFLSGLCGLVYQILWTRQFSFILGNTHLAISIIVASFMFGLFLGSWLIGKFIQNCPNELKWYAYLELIIGSYAMLLLFSFNVIESTFDVLYTAFGKIEFLYTIVKFIATLFFIVLPTIAMGSTLPLAVQYFTKKTESFGENVSLFYAVNTMGGAIGALIGGFFLIEYLGIKNSTILIAIINISIGTIILLSLQMLFRIPGLNLFQARFGIPHKIIDSFHYLGDSVPKQVRDRQNDRQGEFPKELSENPILHQPVEKKQKKDKQLISKQINNKTLLLFYLFTASLAGFTALSYEIIWTRGLKFLIHNSTYSFSIILFVFLTGIALGSNIAKKIIKKTTRLNFIYGFLQLILSIYAVFTIYLLYNFFYVDFFQGRIINIIYDYSYNWLWGISIYIFVCSMVLLIPTIIMGILFPLINQLSFGGIINKTGQTVSTIYAVNTIGSIIGALSAGFLLLSFLGIKISIIIISIINLIIGIIFIFKDKIYILSTLSIGGILFLLFLNLSFKEQYLSGRDEKKEDKVLFYDEGLMSTVKVFEQNKNLYMSIDGKYIASTGRVLLQKEKLIAHLPFFIKPDIKKVLVVGLGSGISTGSISLHNNVERVDCVELIKSVFGGAIYFSNYNYNIFNNKKVNMIYDDVYSYIKNNKEKYDLISSDGKFDPLHSGNTVMLSRDYYDLCKARMEENGLFIQWLPITTPYGVLKVVLNTLKQSFNYVSFFYFYPSDLFMLASDMPITMDKSYMDKIFSDKKIEEDLKILNLKSPLSILSSFIGYYEFTNNETIRLNSFNKPILEFEYIREWKKSKEWEGGYRAKNLEYLKENYQKINPDLLYNSFVGIEKTVIEKNIYIPSLSFFEFCVTNFKKGNLQKGFQEYEKFKNSLEL